MDLIQASYKVAPSASNITNGDRNQAYETSRDELNFSITGNFLIFTTLSFFVSNILLCLLLSYLYSVPYNKEGLLLYLYRDLVKFFDGLDIIEAPIAARCKQVTYL